MLACFQTSAVQSSKGFAFLQRPWLTKPKDLTILNWRGFEDRSLRAISLPSGEKKRDRTAGPEQPGDLLTGPGPAVPMPAVLMPAVLMPAVLMPAWRSSHCLLGRRELLGVCWLWEGS